MGVFDQIIIQQGSTVIATISRAGPLEAGMFDQSGTWIPVAEAQRVGICFVGVDSSGPYYSPDEPPESERGSLWIDPANDLLWVDTQP